LPEVLSFPECGGEKDHAHSSECSHRDQRKRHIHYRHGPEIGIKGFYSANIKKPGSTTLSAKKLYEVVKELPQKEVFFRLKENQWVEISSGKSQFNIMGISAETFPSFPAYEEEDFISLESALLREMIDKTIFAVSSDESRYNLTGVFFTRRESEAEKILRMVATDGYVYP
jgi:DNA polymerase-3 subunit beta